MKRIVYILSCLLAAAVTFSSCSDHERMETESSYRENTITLKLSVPKKTVVRATEEGEDALNENKIATIDVLTYLQGSQTCTHYERLVMTPELDGTAEHSIDLEVGKMYFQKDVPYDIFVIANYPEAMTSGGVTRDELYALTANLDDPDKIESLFMMDALSTAVLNDGSIDPIDIPVSLKRALAKIRVSFEFQNGYSLTGQNNNQSLTKKLVNYAVHTNVVESGAAITPELGSMETFTPESSGAGNADHIIVYSCPNDWNSDARRETYLLINVPISGPGGSRPQNYYRIPVNYRLPENSDDVNLTPEQKEALYKLQRNHLYDIKVYIDQPGSTTPEGAVELEAGYRVENWTTREVVIEIEGLNYLYVRDLDIKIMNTDTYTTIFQSSSSELSVSDILVDSVAVSNGDQGINISWDTGVTSGNLTINSPVPNTFVPRDISFTVSNSDGLEQHITIKQYPNIYLTHNISADAPSGGALQEDNNYLYIITSLSGNFTNLADPDEFDEEGFHQDPDPELGKQYAEYVRTQAILGYPERNAQGETVPTAENNRKVAPRFMLASQHSTSLPTAYTAAKDICINYQENDETTGERYTDWRIPTLAEVYLIDILQNISTSEVKKIMEWKTYWGAWYGSSVKFTDPGIQSYITTQYNACVRCVRDITN